MRSSRGHGDKAPERQAETSARRPGVGSPPSLGAPGRGRRDAATIRRPDARATDRRDAQAPIRPIDPGPRRRGVEASRGHGVERPWRLGVTASTGLGDTAPRRRAAVTGWGHGAAETWRPVDRSRGMTGQGAGVDGPRRIEESRGGRVCVPDPLSIDQGSRPGRRRRSSRRGLPRSSEAGAHRLGSGIVRVSRMVGKPLRLANVPWHSTTVAAYSGWRALSSRCSWPSRWWGIAGKRWWGTCMSCP